MSVLYFLFRIYPCWSIPLAVIFFDLSRQLLKSERKKPAWLLGWMAVLLFITSVIWLLARGDLYSDLWLGNLF